jgi:tight adherence protein C
MELLIAFALFLVITATVTFLGVKMWVRPKEAIERVAGITPLEAQRREAAPAHPSLVIQDILQKLGNYLPANPRDVTIMQRKLIRAGFRGPSALKLLYGAKIFFGIACPLLMTLAVSGSEASASNKILAVLASAALGFFGPNEYIKMAAGRRQHQIRRGLPNALDLLVVCVESGLGLDQAILQVAKELQHAHPEISEEFGLVNLELKAGKRRVDALRNLAERTAVDELKKLVAVLIQADRFGTGIAQSLRGHADFMRVQARQQAEEKAAKLGVKLVFPIFFCILPTLFVVTVGPVAVRIVRELLPMMQSI